MNDNLPHVPEDLAELFAELTDGTLSPEDRERLRARLAADPAAFDVYCKWMHLHALLYLDLQHPRDAMITPPLTPGSLLEGPRPEGRWLSRSTRRWAMGLSGAVAAAIAASLAFVAFMAPDEGAPIRVALQSSNGFRPAPEAIEAFNRTEGDAVAVLSRVADATLAGSKPLLVGSPVRAGKFVVDSGLVQLEFLSGANLVVEGPAELDLVSKSLVVCRRGKLRAYVPDQAKGFMVDTPHHRAVDLGTEFAVSVAADSSSEVHVLDGEVEVYDIDTFDRNARPVETKNLRLGDGLRTSAAGDVAEMAAEPGKFVGVEQLLSLSTEDGLSRYSRWREQTEQWRTDDHVVAYYSFEGHPAWARVLRHDGPSALSSLKGAIVGCRWAEGRWPDKRALEFKSTEDRVRLNIPGEFESITLACWIRIDGFDRWLSSILLTDGHNLGEPHWQFTETGQLLLGVKAEPDQSQEYLTETVLRPTDLGRWIHLACVYNKAQSEVAHYVDGRRVSTQPIVKGIPLRFGPAELGNWIPEELKDHRIRSLNGRIDEFLLRDAAMTDDEVRELFEAGQPHI